jgi:hypothetical protein
MHASHVSETSHRPVRSDDQQFFLFMAHFSYVTTLPDNPSPGNKRRHKSKENGDKTKEKEAGWAVYFSPLPK